MGTPGGIRRSAFAGLATAAIALALAGCTATHTAAPTATVTVPGSAAPSAPATRTPPASSAPSTAPVAGRPCTTANLTGALTAFGGAAGTEYTYVELTNKGSVSCTLQGWPGVSFVGGGNGTQIGPSAALDRSSAHTTVTLGVGRPAYALLAVSGAASDRCKPQKADGVRVYPPGEKASLFIASPYDEACSGISYLSVGAFSSTKQPV